MGKSRKAGWPTAWAVALTLLLVLAQGATASLLYNNVMVNDVQRGNTIGHPDSSRNIAVDSSGAIFVAFHGTNGIRVAKSTDRGATFRASVLVTNVNAQCELAVDHQNALNLVWKAADGTIHFSRSTNQLNFAAPNPVCSSDVPARLAVDAPYVYLIPQGGGPLLRNTNYGAGAFSSVSVDTNRLFSDVIVNLRNHDVFVETDDPDIRYFKSSNYGASFGATQSVARQVRYPSVAGLFVEAGNFLFIAGSSNYILRINTDSNTATNFTAFPSLEHGRSLAADNAGNLLDTYLSSSGVYYRVSTNLGVSFTAPVKVAGSVDAISTTINPIYGDIIMVYEDNGQIFSSVFANELICTNIDLRVESQSIPTCLRPGSELVYTITVTNMSSGTAQDVVLSNQLPAMVTFLGASATVSNHGGGLITYAIGEMTPFTGCNLSITGAVSVAASGSFSNRAEASLRGRDIYPANNVSWANTCVSPTLTIVSPRSTCTPPVGSLTNAYETSQSNSVVTPVTLSSTQYYCTGWSLTGNAPLSGTTNTFSMTHTNDAVLTWIWGITNVQYTVTAGSHGTVTGSSNAWYRQHTSVTAAPQPDAHYHFSTWSGQVPGAQQTANPLILAMDQARSITANFAIDQHTLTVSSEHGTTTPASGVNPYNYNASFTCQAVSPQNLPAGTQYYCTGWTLSGNAPAAGTTNTFNMTLTNNASLTWLWGMTNVRLTATTDGHGSLSGQTSGWYARNQTITISPDAGPFEHFAGWSGDVPIGQTNQNPLNLTMDHARTIQANFWIEQRTVDVASAYGTPSPTVGSHAYDGLSAINPSVSSPVSAGASTQMVCTGWTMTGHAPASGANTSFSMMLTNNASITWNWKTNVYLTRTISGPGTVSGGTSGWYDLGTSLSLTAAPNNAYSSFIGWSGDLPPAQTNDNPLSLNLTNARAIEAHFYQEESSLEVVSPKGTPSPTVGTHSYARGTTLTATPGSPPTSAGTQYICTGWTMTGNSPTLGSSTSFSITLTNNAILTWHWGATNFYYSRSTIGSGSITGSPAGWYSADTTLQAVAIPVPDGTFLGWQLDVPSAQTNNNPLFLNLDRPRNIRALFTEVYRSLIVTSAYGTPNPASGTHSNLHGASVSCSVNSPVSGAAGTRYVCSGWTLTGHSPTSGTTASFATVQTNHMNLTWNWKTNYQFSASAASNGSVTGATSGWYNAQTSVIVTAVPTVGFAFAGWQGSLAGDQTNDNPLNLTLAAPHSVTATFVRASRTLTIQSLYGTPDPPIGIYTNQYGMTLTNRLNGSPVSGTHTSLVCIGWTMTGNAPLTGTNITAVMTHTNNAVLTWLWATNVRLGCSTSGSGTLSGSTNEWTRLGYTNLIHAVPGTGMAFAGWQGELPLGQTNQNPLLLIMDRSRTVTANFERTRLTLEIRSERGTAVPPVGLHTNLYGNVVTNLNSHFVYAPGTQFVCTGWTATGNQPLNGTTNILSMTLTNHAVLTWNWTTNAQLSWSTQGCGGVTGAEAVWYPLGGNVTITALPSANWQFDYWSGDVTTAQSNNASITLTMDRPRTVQAHFSLIMVVDFMIASLSVNSSVDRSSVNATVLIQNIGTDAGDAGILTVWANRPTPANCGEMGDQSITAGTLNAGQVKSYTFTNLYPGAGNKLRSCRAFVDAECATVEKEERNNQYALNYTYLGPVLTPFALSAIALTNEVHLRWTAPTNSGLPNNRTRLLVNTNHYPEDFTDGTKLTDGYTNTFYMHTNCISGTPYYYSIWVNDGTYYVTPPTE